MGSLNDIVFEGKRIGDMQRDELVLVVATLYGQLGEIMLASGPKPIERNQIIMPRQMPGEDSVLETFAAAADMAEDIGPPVVIAPYKPPRDPRVRGVLRAAAKERAAEAEAKPREIFRDPRLDPSYGKKKK